MSDKDEKDLLIEHLEKAVERLTTSNEILRNLLMSERDKFDWVQIKNELLNAETKFELGAKLCGISIDEVRENMEWFLMDKELQDDTDKRLAYYYVHFSNFLKRKYKYDKPIKDKSKERDNIYTNLFNEENL